VSVAAAAAAVEPYGVDGPVVVATAAVVVVVIVVVVANRRRRAEISASLVAILA